MINKEIALVLEGGGVKCAYELGAMMALEEMGYHFISISGASFGALNGALYLQGGIKAVFDFYNNFDQKSLYIDEYTIDFVNNYNGDKNDFTNAMMNHLKESSGDLMNKRSEISNHYQPMIKSLIDNKKVKDSPIELYMSELEVSNSPLILPMILGAYFSKNKAPLELLKNTGQISPFIMSKNDVNFSLIADYIVASANYPICNPYEIEGRYYLDGGITNNVPYEILLEKGYENIVIIRTNIEDLDENLYKYPNILEIRPKESLGSSLYFTRDNIMELMKQGYQDVKAKLG